MKLSEAIAHFDLSRRGEVSESTRQWFTGRLLALVKSIGDVEVTAVTINDLRRWRAELLERESRWADSDVRPTAEGGLSQDSLRNYIRAGRQFFKWLHDEGLIPNNPAARLSIPPPSTEEPKAIPVEDARHILWVARLYALRDWAYYWLKEETGAKVGELDRLRREDVDPQNGRVTLHHYTRYKYIPRPASYGRLSGEALVEWCCVRAVVTAVDEGDLLFTGRTGQFPIPLKGKLALGVRNEAILQVLASSACRVGGVASMRVDRLNLEAGTATVWEKGRGGYPRSRQIYLDGEACDVLSRWLTIHPGGDALFPGIRGPMTRDGIYQVMISLAIEAGVEAYANPHAWRHAWSIEALRRGADVTTVARVLGNSPQTVIQSYARWASSDVQQRHAQFNWKQDREKI